MLHVHSLTFHARLRQTKTTNCPSVSRCPTLHFRRLLSRFLFLLLPLTSMRNDLTEYVTAAKLIHGRKDYIALPVPREESHYIETWITIEIGDDAENCFVKFLEFRYCGNFEEYRLSVLFHFHPRQQLITFHVSSHVQYLRLFIYFRFWSNESSKTYVSGLSSL